MRKQNFKAALSKDAAIVREEIRKQSNVHFLSVDNEQQRQQSINLHKKIFFNSRHDKTAQENVSNLTIILDNNQIIRYYCTNLKLRRQQQQEEKHFGLNDVESRQGGIKCLMRKYASTSKIKNKYRKERHFPPRHDEIKVKMRKLFFTGEKSIISIFFVALFCIPTRVSSSKRYDKSFLLHELMLCHVFIKNRLI